MANHLYIVLPGLALCTLLALAVWNDVLTRRIPNRLVLLGTLIGLVMNSVFPLGAGFFSEPSGAVGFLAALGATCLGLATLLPLYAIGAMGAGDVKLMAMVGAFLGPDGVLGAALLSLLAGGILALAIALWTGTLVRVLSNTGNLLKHTAFRAMSGTGVHIDKPVTPTGKLAYAIAIMSGTCLQIFLSTTTDWSLLP
jgi:prepilin peptidase CpaA